MAGFDANTKLLLHCEGADESTTITDSVGTHTPSAVGTAQIDTTYYKWGSSALLLDGDSDYVTIPDHADWDILTTTNVTIDFFARFADHAGIEYLIEQGEDTQNRWFLKHTDGAGFNFSAASGGATIVTTSSGGEVTDSSWHHVALIKVGTLYGIYVDGTQVAYVDANSTDTFAAALVIGRYLGNDYYFNGSIDEVRIQHSNIFNATPNATPDDTISVPTSAYSKTIASQAVIL